MTWVSPRVIRGNRGDIISRYGILQELVSEGVAVSAVFAHRESHVPPGLRGRVRSYGPLYNLWPGLGGLASLWRAKYVIWTGGLDLQDDSSLLKLVHLWLVFLSYRLLGLRILIALQGAGPLTTSRGRWLVRRILTCVEFALVRDRGSHRLLVELMGEGRVGLAADGIFLEGLPTRHQPGPAPASILALTDTGGRPVVGLNVRLWFHFGGNILPYQFARERYRQRARAPMECLLLSLQGLVRHLRSRYSARIILLSMYEPAVEGWEDDQPWLDQIKEEFEDDPDVVICTDDLSVDELCQLFTRLDLMVGMRLHATLIALRTGVPAIHLSYTLKGRDIYSDLGLADWIVDIDDVMRSPERLIETVDRVLAEPGRHDRIQNIVTRTIAENRGALSSAVERLGRV